MSESSVNVAGKLSDIVENIHSRFTEVNALRDETLNRSRLLIRLCAASIRAIHRHEWEEATQMLQEAKAAAGEMVEPLADFPELYHSGYTQDALKELVEAHLVMAVVQGTEPPGPEELYVSESAYLRGMSEAATEMRRFVLDLMRRGQVAEAEQYLTFMDEVYSLLITIDFPDSLTHGLRRSTDILRGVLERTRGDLTMGLRQDQMRESLRAFESRLGMEVTSE